MTCDLCGARGSTVTLLDIYKTAEANEVCLDCASDLDKLKATCRKLSDKTTTKINNRAEKIAANKRKKTVFWSLLQASTAAIKTVISSAKPTKEKL